MDKMNRRDFLKGLLAVSGGVVLAANMPLEWAVGEAEAEAVSMPQKPFGSFGSVRLDEKWYPLHGASITTLRRHDVPLWVGGNDVIRPTVLPKSENSLVNAPWEIEFEMGEPYEHPEMAITSFYGMTEFEIDSGRGIRFVGKGWAVSESTQMMTPDFVRYYLRLEGEQKLERLL